MDYFRQRFIDELNDEGMIRIRTFEWLPDQVLLAMSREDYDAHFVDWVGTQKQNAKDRTREFLEEFGCLDRFNRLHDQLKGRSVLPFVGAGLSRPTGFPLWGVFLEQMTADYPALDKQVRLHLAAFEYENAAQALIDSIGPEVFAEAIQNAFGSRSKTLKGPVLLLPSVFTHGCITTNFDYVLNRVYEEAEMRFKGEFVGARLNEAPRLFANEPHSLFRLHGEADSSQGRVLTSNEYDACYENTEGFTDMLAALVSTRSLLFLGCSLTVDRTLRALIRIAGAAKIQTPRHFAFLPLGATTDRAARRNELSQANIHPIWYPSTDHDQAIEDLLISLMEGGFHD